MADEPSTIRSLPSVVEMRFDVSLGARRFQVPAGTTFYEPDMAARALFFVHDGQVRIYPVIATGCEPVLEVLSRGEWFGIEALCRLQGFRYGTRAVAVTTATVSEVPAARLLAVLPNHPQTARELLGQMSSKLQRLWARGQPHPR